MAEAPGYHQQARVENAFYRYKQLIGGRLRNRNIQAQATEVRLAVNVLNRMLDRRIAIGTNSKLSEDKVGSVRLEQSCNNATECGDLAEHPAAMLERQNGSL